MNIDTSPTLNENNLTIEVAFDIDSSEEISIMINGLLAIVSDDVSDITDNVITLKEAFDIDWNNDSFEVLYSSL
jgi:hypothetical protein